MPQKHGLEGDDRKSKAFNQNILIGPNKIISNDDRGINILETDTKWKISPTIIIGLEGLKLQHWRFRLKYLYLGLNLSLNLILKEYKFTRD